MLSQDTINIIKSTAPVLQENGVVLTKHFYKKMFENNPEVLPYFNLANQAKGSQQEALAGAICAYAMNIDNLGALGEAVELITHKHASLKVMPEHYPIVGVNLLGAIKDVLGDTATDEIINAWKDAYFFLADIFIDAEKKIYEEQAYKGFKKFKVTNIVDENELIKSFHLVPIDGSIIPKFNAGQFTTVRVPLENSTTMRNYSLSNFGDSNFLRISVKRALGKPNGHVSNFLHDQISVGDEVELAAPSGVFTYKGMSQNCLFLAGGIGITPLLSMLNAINPETNAKFVYATKSKNEVAFKNELNNLSENNENIEINYFYENSDEILLANEYRGRIEKSFLSDLLKDNSEIYICGPKAFMQAMKKHLIELGVAESSINIEFFGPQEAI